jgi:DNA-binding transcriptional regulator YiaG
LPFSCLKDTASELAERHSIALREARTRQADALKLRSAYDTLDLSALSELADWLDVLPSRLQAWAQGEATMPTSVRRSLGQKLRFLDPDERLAQGKRQRKSLEQLDLEAEARARSISTEELASRFEDVGLLRRLQDARDWTQRDLAEAFDVALSTVEHWMQARQPLPGPARTLARVWLDE